MYTTSVKTQYILKEGNTSQLVFLVNDKPVSSGQALLSEYLADARSIFKSECDILLATDRVFTEQDASRLTIMLKLLMDARKTWQEEEIEAAKKASV